jgi:hypothetical protein
MSDSSKMVNPPAPPSWGSPLTAADYLALESSWITRELADSGMLRRVDAEEGRQAVGQKGSLDCAGILIPYYWPGETSPHTYRLRRDNPELRQSKKGGLKPYRKYLAPVGDGNRLYIPPGVTLQLLQDVTIPVVIVEGEKKAVALWRLANFEVEKPRFIPTAIPGVWNWQGRIGKTSGPRGERLDVHGPIADLDRVNWKARKAFILFDANVHTNYSVKSARNGIARELTSRGAEVCFVNLPEDCGVNGVDDLLATWGPKRVLELFEHSQPGSPKGNPGQAEMLVRFAAHVRLFHTSENEPFAHVPTGRHHKVLTLRSGEFRLWLMREFHRELGKPPGAQALLDAVNMLAAQAQFDSPEAPLFVRVAEQQDRIYIDLGNPEGEVVEINAQAWRILADPPVYFRRPRGLHALPRPVMGGSVTSLRKFINVGDDHNWILCVSWLVAALRPRGPFPILILQGEQGSAKSTMARILRRLVDPSAAPVRTPPREERDLLIAACNSWVVGYDNLSRIPQWLSDALCRLSTGGGFSTRELYTDSDEIFFDATRPVILNGIDHLAERADLADRALTLDLLPIDELNRREEEDLYRDFESEMPQILGALFTAVCGALAHLPDTRLERRPRMADFARWATAAEQPLGFPRGAFMAAYAGNRAETVRETLEADPVGAAVIVLMDRLSEEQQGTWEGISQDLKRELEQFVDEGTKKAAEWPKSPRGLSGRLRRLVTFFRESGIQIVFPGKGSKGQRLLVITRTGGDSTATTATSVFQDPDGPAEQLVGADEPGGGSAGRVADDPLTGDEPPPAQQDFISLNRKEGPVGVAEVAVVSPTPLRGTSSTGKSDPTYSCSKCGPVEWEWNGNAWACPHCGAPAPGQQIRGADIERFEL